MAPVSNSDAPFERSLGETNRNEVLTSHVVILGIVSGHATDVPSV